MLVNTVCEIGILTFFLGLCLYSLLNGFQSDKVSSQALVTETGNGTSHPRSRAL